LEINAFRYYIAPFIGACIALPILALLFYFILEGSFNLEFLLGDIVNRYISDTSILVLELFWWLLFLGNYLLLI
jgi:iron(III) transport system permease protein